jgi:hypothetical protein
MKESAVYERCLNEAEFILSDQQEPLMPVRKVWEEIAKRSRIKGFEMASLSDFSAMLDGDNRFQIIPGQVKVQEDEEVVGDIDSEDSEMEQLGFFAEDRVKLRSKKIAEPMASEDDEEVGSIRRMSFAGQTAKPLNLSKNKKIAPASNKTVVPPRKKKSLPQKKKSVKRSASTKRKKSSGHKRGRK